MATTQNYYAENPLNRLSYLRSAPNFLASALSSPKAKFLLLDNLNPLFTKNHAGEVGLASVGWDTVGPYLGDPHHRFHGVDGKDPKTLAEPEGAFWLAGQKKVAEGEKVKAPSGQEKQEAFINQPALVFLGCDERGAPEEAKSLPLSKPDENSTLESHAPHGLPYWALDVTRLAELKSEALKKHEGSEFLDMRASMSKIGREDAAIGAEARALVDWNKRNVFCTACSRPLRSVWAGWKRTCIPAEPAAGGVEVEACSSKKGVHNFNYPRTDPVCIMAVVSPDKSKILLGRQRVWPAKFYSCLAGFIESGETLEEAVRREVYEEAGVECGEVFYHSSQPWPYPSSLMLGAIAVAKEGQRIRCDLDNELEDARYFTREEVLGVLASTEIQLSRHEVAKIDGKEGAEGEEADKKKAEDEQLFRMPPSTAIAHVLIKAWAEGKYPGAKL